MAKNTEVNDSALYIAPLSINGLNGRVLKIPAAGKKKRDILIVYGQHTSLERMYSIAQDLSQYGTVTLPDLPGFGGMDSFYRIGQKPTLDNMADYLATFIKMYYRRKRFTIAGMSLGFLIVTRMLQRHPDIAKQINLTVSYAGLTNKNDFHFSGHTLVSLKTIAWFCQTYVGSWFAQHVALNKIAISAAYRMSAKRHPKMRDANNDELRERIAFEVRLWQANDIRTQGYTALEMFRADLSGATIPHRLHHIAVDADQYFDNVLVENHMREIFKAVRVHKAVLPNHVPTILADVEAAQIFTPKSIRTLLARSPT